MLPQNTQLPFNPTSNPASFPVSINDYLPAPGYGWSDYAAPRVGSVIGGYFGGQPGSILGGALGGALTNSPLSTQGGQIGQSIGGGLGSFLGSHIYGGADYGRDKGSGWGKSIGSTLGGALGGATYGGFDINSYPNLKAFGNHLNMAFPETNAAGSTPKYAHGGRINHVPHMAEMIRQHGQRGDQILAHINPEEAYELGEKYGWDINPETGLPQYGFFSGLGKIFKSILPILGTVVGGVLGGPLGGILGGSVGGGLAGSGGNRNDILGGVLGGGLGGAISGYGGQALSSLFGSAGAQGAASGIRGALGSSAHLTPGAQMMINRGIPEVLAKQSSSLGTGGIGSFLGGLAKDAMNNPLNTILGLTTIAGTLGRREKLPHQPTTEESIAAYEKFRKAIGDKSLSEIEGAAPREYVEEEEPVEYGKTRSYFKNNRVFKGGGYLDGHTGGQDDKIEARLSDGEYVLDAQTVSHLGDGNNAAGAKKLDEFRRKLRSHKKQKGFPPKAHSIEYYMNKADRR